jgi:hypothetical protein
MNRYSYVVKRETRLLEILERVLAGNALSEEDALFLNRQKRRLTEYVQSRSTHSHQ